MKPEKGPRNRKCGKIDFFYLAKVFYNKPELQNVNKVSLKGATVSFLCITCDWLLFFSMSIYISLHFLPFLFKISFSSFCLLLFICCFECDMVFNDFL